jgi:hypothetical protein
MDEAELRYLAIWAWWLSLGAASEDAIRDLNLWLAFWHFRYCQWGGCMQMVSPSSLAYLVIQSHIRLHNWTLNSILISLLFQGLSLEEMADMPSCNLSETPIIIGCNNLVTVATTYLLLPATTRYERSCR